MRPGSFQCRFIFLWIEFRSIWIATRRQRAEYVHGKLKYRKEKFLNAEGRNIMPAAHSRRVHLATVVRDETGRVRLSTLLSRALNFGARHEATVRQHTSPFDSCSQTAKKARL